MVAKGKGWSIFRRIPKECMKCVTGLKSLDRDGNLVLPYLMIWKFVGYKNYKQQL
jgi:hypothetical protein